MDQYGFFKNKQLSNRDKLIMAILVKLNQMVRDAPWIGFFQLSRSSTYQVSGTREIMMEFSNTWEMEGDEDRVTLRLFKDNSSEDYSMTFTFKRPPRCAYLSQEELKLDFPCAWSGGQLDNSDLAKYGIMLDAVYPDKEDKDMSSEQLEMKYLDLNGGYHPTYTVGMWKEAVAGDSTRDGYWDWVKQEFNQQ